MNDKIKALALLSSLQKHRADDYDTWIKVGMALHSTGASCADWDNWSKQSSKYQVGVCERKWKSFSNYTGTPITIASLAQFAKEDGYVSKSTLNVPKKNTPSQELISYLKVLFKSGDTINYIREYFERNGKFNPIGNGTNKSFDSLITALSQSDDIQTSIGKYNANAGAWIRLNPITGIGNKDADVVDCRHCLIEADTLPKDEQLQKLKELKIPCVAIVDSGGKSIHAIVRINAGKDERLFRDRVAELHRYLELRGFPVDKACKNPSRLSRLPGVYRNGVRQKLIEVNPDALSWDKWLILQEDLKLDVIRIDDIINADPNDTSDNLIGKRFLCRDGSWLIIAQSGIGKSVFAMQVAMHFAIGKSIFELNPHTPKRVILMQAENNRLDLMEPSKSILSQMQVSPEELELLRENLFIISENKSSGALFIKILEKVCARYVPDIVIIDPLLSYIGDDISLQAVCSSFLRNQLNPIIHKYNFGLIFMHHTGKPPKDKPVKNVADLAYLGIGSSELTNWARAVSVMVQNSDDNSVYELTHAKRGRRSGVEGRTFLRHASEGKIYWQTTTQPEKQEDERECKYSFLKLEYMPELPHDSDYAKSRVFEYICQKLREHRKPSSFYEAKKVFDATRRREANILIFDRDKKVWRGVLYKTEGVA